MANRVYYDDRLATAIAGPAPQGALADVQYRQIIDLLADARPADNEAEAALLAGAGKGRYFSQNDFARGLVRLSALAKDMAAEGQSAAITQSMRPLTSPPLIRFLLDQPKQVREATLGKTRINSADWLEILRTLSPEQQAELSAHVAASANAQNVADPGLTDESVTGEEAVAERTSFTASKPALIATGKADPVNETLIAEKKPIPSESPALSENPALSESPALSENPALSEIKPDAAAQRPKKLGADIGGIVERIANYTARRESSTAPHLPLEEFARETMVLAEEIAFFTDSDGVISSAEPEIEGIAIGLPVFSHAGETRLGCDARTASLAAKHQPVVNGRYEHRGAAALAGVWRVDSWPRFDHYDKRFIGYYGILTRLNPVEEDPMTIMAGKAGYGSVSENTEGTVLETPDYRQLVHELRTPAGALKGFAEILQAQLFGPVAAPYRNMAQAVIDDTDAVLQQLARLQKSEAEQA